MLKNEFIKLLNKQIEKIMGKRSHQEMNSSSYEQQIDDGISKFACRFIVNNNKNE